MSDLNFLRDHFQCQEVRQDVGNHYREGKFLHQ